MELFSSVSKIVDKKWTWWTKSGHIFQRFKKEENGINVNDKDRIFAILDDDDDEFDFNENKGNHTNRNKNNTGEEDYLEDEMLDIKLSCENVHVEATLILQLCQIVFYESERQ